jgi:hypothetical protein
MSSSGAIEISALKAEITEMSERLAHVATQLERLEQQSPHVPHTSATSSNVAARTSPLDKGELLDTVLSYVDIGDYFFTAAVCSSWRRRYLKLRYSAAANHRRKRSTVLRLRKPKPTTAAAEKCDADRS